MDHSTKLEMIRLKCISDSLKNIFVTKTKTNHNTVPGVYIYIYIKQAIYGTKYVSTDVLEKFNKKGNVCCVYKGRLSGQHRTETCGIKTRHDHMNQH
jgi:hypothetical protein